MTLSTSSSRAVRTRTGAFEPVARRRRRTSKPSMPGQADVEHDEVRRLVRGEVEALLAGAGDGDLVALLLEGVLDAAGDGELVFDDQDRCGHRRGCYTGCAREGREPADPARSVIRCAPFPGAPARRAQASRARPDRTPTEVPIRMPTPRPPARPSPRSPASDRQEGRPPPPRRPAARRRLRPRRSIRRA